MIWWASKNFGSKFSETFRTKKNRIFHIEDSVIVNSASEIAPMDKGCLADSNVWNHLHL